MTSKTHIDETPSEALKRLTLLIELRCNSYCVFCGLREVDEAVVRVRKRLGLSIPDVPFVKRMQGQRYTLESATQALVQARDEGYNALSLQGGEPTLWPELPALIARAREMGFQEVVIVTNGRRLAKRAWAEELIDAGLTGIVVSILGADAETHDRLSVSPGSFNELLAGVDNCVSLAGERGSTMHVNANLVTSGQSIAGLPEQIHLLAQHGVESGTVHLVRFDLFGVDPKVVKDLQFPISHATQPLRDAFQNSQDTGVSLHAGDIPPCLHPWLRPDDLRGMARQRDVLAHRFAGPGFEYQSDPLSPHCLPDICDGCVMASLCGRAPDAYLPDGAEEAFTPITAAWMQTKIASESGGGERVRLRLEDWMGAAAFLLESDLLEASEVGPVVAALRDGFGRLCESAWRDRDAHEMVAAVYGLLGLRPPTDQVTDDVSSILPASLEAFASHVGAQPATSLAGESLHLLVFGPGYAVAVRGDRVGDDEVTVEELIPIRPEESAPGGHPSRALFLLYIAGALQGAKRIRISDSALEIHDGTTWRICLSRAAPWAVRIDSR